MESRETRIRYETRAKILKALAHPSRLKLVDRLAEQEEVCVCDLTEVIGSDMSTVSRHLSQLRAAGIVESEKRGQMVYYRLRVKCLKSLFACIESVVKCNVDEHLIVLS
jgi:ArsR family transcriptional regulator